MFKGFTKFDWFLFGALIVLLVGNFVVLPLTHKDTNESRYDRTHHEVRSAGG